MASPRQALLKLQAENDQSRKTRQNTTANKISELMDYLAAKAEGAFSARQFAYASAYQA